MLGGWTSFVIFIWGNTIVPEKEQAHMQVAPLILNGIQWSVPNIQSWNVKWYIFWSIHKFNHVKLDTTIIALSPSFHNFYLATMSTSECNQKESLSSYHSMGSLPLIKLFCNLFACNLIGALILCSINEYLKYIKESFVEYVPQQAHWPKSSRNENKNPETIQNKSFMVTKHHFLIKQKLSCFCDSLFWWKNWFQSLFPRADLMGEYALFINRVQVHQNWGKITNFELSCEFHVYEQQPTLEVNNKYFINGNEIIINCFCYH